MPPIVCTVDDRYVDALLVLMQSVWISQPAPSALRVIVLHGGLSAAARRRIRFHAEHLQMSVELREVPPATDRFPVSEWFSEAIYLRLAVAEAVADQDVVLYLDADTIVLDDLMPLLCTEIAGVALAAVRDAQYPVIGRGLAMPGWRELGLPAGRDNFNSGVMLLNLRECARREVFARSRYFLRELHRHARYWDQDALNWAVDDCWLRLDRRWNTLPLSVLSAEPGFVHFAEDILPLADLIADEDTAAILHFAGPDKPWQPTYPAGPLRDRYTSLARPISIREVALA